MWARRPAPTMGLMANTKPARIRNEDVTVGTRRGGELRIVLGPETVACRSGYGGTAILRPGERVIEHYHPFSEEFLYAVRGELVVDIEGEEWPLAPGESIYIPIGTRHRLRNVGTEDSFTVFHLGPLAPDPSLSHVDTEIVTDLAGRAAKGGIQTARINFSMRVAEEKRADFLAAYEKVRYNVANTAGHIRDQICQVPDDPDQWMITSEWASMEDFWAWEKSDEHKELVRPMRACYSAPEFRSFAVVGETASRP
jgi:heme-degrading monooxygenase HmoA/oxalate decarboxylase/phosphoglucose isomerase-like protein (cupin superfamily)